MNFFSRSLKPVSKYVQTLPGSPDISKLFQSARFISPRFRSASGLLNIRHFSKSTQHQKECREIEIPIPGGVVAAKAWGSETGYPVLALHGWQDNCGTFDKLMPLLSDKFYYVAIDAPGHGISPHKPFGCVYTDVSMVMDFKRVVDSLGWKKFHVLGHSLGAVFGLLFSCTFPDLVHKLALLDAAKPYSVPEEQVAMIKIAGIKVHLDSEDKMSNPAPVYSAEAAVQRLTKGMNNEVDEDGIRILLKRGARVSDCGKGLVFTRDLRMKPLELISVRSHNTTENFMSALKCELLVIMAKNTHPNYQMDKPEITTRFTDFYKKTLKHFEFVSVEGNHFVHLNNPERVAPYINKFMLDENKS